MKKCGIRNCIYVLLAIVLFVTAVSIAVLCREMPPVLLKVPEEAVRQVENLMDAVCSGHFSEAEQFLYGQPDLGADRKLEAAVDAMIWEAYIKSLDYELQGGLYATASGLMQDVKLISMELDTVTANLGSRAKTLLSSTIESAGNVAEIYDEKNNYREDLVMETMEEAVRQALEEDVRYTYQILSLPLVYSGGQWWIRPEEGCGGLLDRFEMYMNHVTSDALEGVLSIEKVYWLLDENPVAPKPDEEHYGEATNPLELVPVIERAEKLLDGQELAFQTDTEIREDSTITYYLDETILCITWQHMVDGAVYTCSEVKIAHPSQFRRFLSDDRFASGKLYKATEMAASVNAVTASNGDYYAYRGYGNLVYHGEVKMAENRYMDTCYVDEKGDLILVDFGKLYKKEDVQRFVDEHGIRFSLAFGPILVEDGRVTAKYDYAVGQTDGYYSRSALCQMGPLHYMFVTVNRRGKNISQFAKHLQELGVDKAYALDGGQTSTIVTGNELMNPVDYGGERETSDIIYFATALPQGG